MPEPEEDKSGNGALEIGAFGLKLKLTGKLARYTLAGVTILCVTWYAGFSKPQAILDEIRSLRKETVSTKLTLQALVKTLPKTQQALIQHSVEDQLAMLKQLQGEGQ